MTTITIAASSLSKPRGTSINFAGNEFTVTAGELESGDYVEDVSFSCGAGESSPAGKYPIAITSCVIKNVNDENVTQKYAITYETGTLEITEAEPAPESNPRLASNAPAEAAKAAIIGAYLANCRAQMMRQYVMRQNSVSKQY